MGARGPAGPSTCDPEPGDGPTRLGLRQAGAGRGTGVGFSPVPGRSAGLPPRRRGEELHGRGGAGTGRLGAGPAVAGSEVQSRPRFASGAGR